MPMPTSCDRSRPIAARLHRALVPCCRLLGAVPDIAGMLMWFLPEDTRRLLVYAACVLSGAKAKALGVFATLGPSPAGAAVALAQQTAAQCPRVIRMRRRCSAKAGA